MSGGFFRGTNLEQDTRFANKNKALMKKLNFPKEFDTAVDLRKVNLDVIRPWVAKRVTELLTFEDEVVIGFITGLLDHPPGGRVDPKDMQLNLTGFMEKNTSLFMKELWGLLLSAQANCLGGAHKGIPQAFLDAEAARQAKAAEETARIAAELAKRREELGAAVAAEDARRRAELGAAVAGALGGGFGYGAGGLPAGAATAAGGAASGTRRRGRWDQEVDDFEARKKEREQRAKEAAAMEGQPPAAAPAAAPAVASAAAPAGAPAAAPAGDRGRDDEGRARRRHRDRSRSRTRSRSPRGRAGDRGSGGRREDRGRDRHDRGRGGRSRSRSRSRERGRRGRSRSPRETRRRSRTRSPPRDHQLPRRDRDDAKGREVAAPAVPGDAEAQRLEEAALRERALAALRRSSRDAAPARE